MLRPDDPEGPATPAAAAEAGLISCWTHFGNLGRRTFRYFGSFLLPLAWPPVFKKELEAGITHGSGGS